MGRVKSGERIQTYPVGLKMRHITYIEENPEFKIHKFVRDQLDKFIILKQKVEEIANEQN